MNCVVDGSSTRLYHHHFIIWYLLIITHYSHNLKTINNCNKNYDIYRIMFWLETKMLRNLCKLFLVFWWVFNVVLCFSDTNVKPKLKPNTVLTFFLFWHLFPGLYRTKLLKYKISVQGLQYNIVPFIFIRVCRAHI